MRELFTNQMLTIEPGQTISGIAHRARTLRILGGSVWITVEGIAHDYWLSAGDTFTVIPGRLVVVEATGNSSRVDTRGPAARDAVRRLRGLFADVAWHVTHGRTATALLQRRKQCSEAC